MFPLMVQFAGGDDRFFIRVGLSARQGFVHPVRTTRELLAALPPRSVERFCATKKCRRVLPYLSPAVQRFGGTIRWRENVSVCPSFDFDAMSVWLGSFNATSPSAISRGEFGAVRDRTPAGNAGAMGNQVDPAGFIPGHTIDTYPDLVPTGGRCGT